MWYASKKTATCLGVPKLLRRLYSQYKITNACSVSFVIQILLSVILDCCNSLCVNYKRSGEKCKCPTRTRILAHLQSDKTDIKNRSPGAGERR